MAERVEPIAASSGWPLLSFIFVLVYLSGQNPTRQERQPKPWRTPHKREPLWAVGCCTRGLLRWLAGDFGNRRSLLVSTNLTHEDTVNWLRSKELTLFLFGLLTIAWAIWMTPDGYVANDEAIYHMMTVSLISEGNLFIWNGYEEFPSPELVFSLARVYDGHLYPQYPVFFSIIAYPFVYLLGFKGFYLISAISLLATTIICFYLAKSLFHDTDLAANACLIFLFATFSWEYGQSAWPHAVAVFLIVLSAYLASAAYRSPRIRSSLATALAAGLVVGFGVGVRLDTVLVLPAIIAPFLFASPWRPREAIAIGAGAVPALGVVALTNDLKFGVFSPMSYGAASNPVLVFESYVPIVMLSVGGLAAAWLVTRRTGRDLLRTRPMAVAGGLVLLAGAAFVTLDLWIHGARLASGVYKLLVDLGIGETEAVPAGAVRGPGGALIFIGGVKKAFLQSCPYLAAAVIPAAALIRGVEDRGPLSMLFLIPGAFVVFYSYFAWHGGAGLNLRYFLPVLPFTSILVAYAWRELNRGLSSRWSLPRRTVAATTALVFSTLMVLGLMVLGRKTGDEAQSIATQEIMFRAIPLVIFAVLLGLMLLVLIFGTKTRPWVRGTSSLVLIGAFAWSCMTAYENDYLRAYILRAKRANLDEQLARVVEPNSIIFTNTQNSFYRLWVNHRVRIAVPWYDDFGDFQALRMFHAERGRATYVWLNEGMEDAIKERRLFDDLETVPVFDLPGRGALVQVIETPAASSSAPD